LTTALSRKTIATPSQDEIRSKRLAFLSKIDGTGTSTSAKSDNTQPEKCNGCDKTDETSELICQQNNGKFCPGKKPFLFLQKSRGCIYLMQ
jgi:hypothetical protein